MAKFLFDTSRGKTNAVAHLNNNNSNNNMNNNPCFVAILNLLQLSQELREGGGRGVNSSPVLR